ncbi:MAG: efflux RND transporter permease subunit [Deltaproteobacteria bacterium]|nr:efflux RND transporter permease subunit [Deltaproteobacteria bacterium]
MKIFEIPLKYSFMLNLATFFLVLIGIFYSLNIKREAFPSIDFGNIAITTVYPGASPREVEQYVTNRIEEEIDNIEGIDEFTSSSRQGLSFIFIKLLPELNALETQTAVNDIQRAVDRVRDLPKEVINLPLVKEFSSAELPVMEVALSGEMPYTELHEHVDKLYDILRRIPEAGQPSLVGFREKELWVEVDPDKLRAHHVGLTEVVSTLGAKNINLPGGVLKSKAGDYIVRTLGEVVTPEEIDQIVLRTNLSGNTLRIQDIGKTVSSFAEDERYYRTNGRPSINLVIKKKKSGDVLALTSKVKDAVKEYQSLPGNETLQASFVNDISRFVSNRLGILLNNGMVGLILVIITLLIFLSRGIALVTAMGMPVAVIGALLVMNAFGMTINLLTMFALVIVLGMLVDDSIIVAENIWQHYEDGKGPWEAAVAGTKEVFLPVTATILTTIAAFTPLLMMSGIMGKFIVNLPQVIIIALTISLLEAIFILPAHAYDVLRFNKWRRQNTKSGVVKPLKKESGPMFHVLNVYERILELSIRWRYLCVSLAVAVLFFFLYVAFFHMKIILFPEEGTEAFFVRGNLTAGTSEIVTSEKMKVFERIIAEKIPRDEIKDYVTYIGRQQMDAMDPLGANGSHLGQVGVYLTPESERDRTAPVIMESIRDDILQAGEEAGFEKITFVKLRGGPPVGKPVAIRVFGEDLEEMRDVSKTIQKNLAEKDGVSDIQDSYIEGKREIQVDVLDGKASQHLTSTQEIALHVRATLEGQIASYVNDKSERIPVRVRYNEPARGEVEAIKNTRFINHSGQLVPLSDVAEFRESQGVNAINHYQGKRVITVTADLNEKKVSSTELADWIRPHLDGLMGQHPDIRLEAGGEYEDTTESMRSLRDSFYVALCLIFLILATQFRSLTQPIVVMTAIPFGIIGVIIAFYLHSSPLNFLGLIGSIGLTGVVVNDSIVLVDFINHSRARGVSPYKAVLYAGRRRFRAVLLTSITTIAGLIPLVYGIGGSDLFLRPAAMALGYGLLFATALVLFLIPSLYLIRLDLMNVMIFLTRPFVRTMGGNLNYIKIRDDD